MAEENKAQEKNTEKTTTEKNAAHTNAAQQQKLKKQTATETEIEKLKNEDPKVLRQKLSNKNLDYVFRLEKELEKQGAMNHAEAAKKVDPLLGEIIVAQYHGQPANGLYMASPKIKADQILHPKRKPKDTPLWQRMVDGSLLYLALFVGMFGVVALFERNVPQNSQMGILTLASVGILMGMFMTRYNDIFAPQRGKKVPWAKIILSFLGLVVGLFIWIWFLSLPVIRVINPVLPGVTDVVIAAAAYGIRYLFRRHYHIVGSAFAPNPRHK